MAEAENQGQVARRGRILEVNNRYGAIKDKPKENMRRPSEKYNITDAANG